MTLGLGAAQGGGGGRGVNKQAESKTVTQLAQTQPTTQAPATLRGSLRGVCEQTSWVKNSKTAPGNHGSPDTAHHPGSPATLRAGWVEKLHPYHPPI